MATDRENKKVLFLSLNAERAKKIISGKINAEIKQIAPEVIKGDIIMIYARSPIEQIIGMCTVESIIKAEPDKLWDIAGQRSGIKKSEMINMLKDMSFGYAMIFKNPIPMYKPINLKEIKSLLPGFMPPRNCKYFTYSQFMNLMNSSAKYASLS